MTRWSPVATSRRFVTTTTSRSVRRETNRPYLWTRGLSRTARISLTLRVYDAAGNMTSVPHPDPIQVHNIRSEAASVGVAVTPGVPAGALSLFASSGNASRTSLVVPWGRRVEHRGRLTAASAQDIGGAEVEVRERTARKGARERPVGQIRTGPNGESRYARPARRPSRTLIVVHRVLGGTPVVSKTLKLSVRAASTLKATLRGTLVRFTGRVVSRPLPAGGKLVKLQGSAPAFAWS